MIRTYSLYHSNIISSFTKSTKKLNRPNFHNGILATHFVKSCFIGRNFTTVKDGEIQEKITPRSIDYSQWYANVIACSDMVDQSPVRGCMVIKPWGMAVWDAIRADLDAKIRESGAQNAYFPLFIPMSFLSKEAEHVEGFAKECAVVTHHRLCKSPDGKGLMADPEAQLDEPLIIRPTSETIIWHMFAKWIQSHRDLPLKINQWANVVRWEVRTRPFLRTTEFLWQEGHTAHATREDALQTTTEAIDMYADLCENLLAVPCVVGEKSPSERFAGAEKTFTIEALMQNGWALQAGTSHFLGQNFAKAFDVSFSTDDEGQSNQLVWATSWGVSTRLIGALVMTHSDDKGLVLPPLLAPTQVVIMPILKVGSDNPAVLERMRSVERALRAAKIRVKVDDRQHVRPGPKYFHWERKGLPIRIDIGPRDVEGNTVVMTLRHSGKKVSVAFTGEGEDDDSFARAIGQALKDMQSDLLQQAKERLAANTHRVELYAEMRSAILSASAAAAASAESHANTTTTTITDATTSESQNKRKNKSNKHASEKGMSNTNASKLGFYVVPWKCDAANEEFVKKDCSATIRCYPRDLNRTPPAVGVKCFYSGDQATHYAMFARAF